jgi:hypothetical protein
LLHSNRDREIFIYPQFSFKTLPVSFELTSIAYLLGYYDTTSGSRVASPPNSFAGKDIPILRKRKEEREHLVIVYL